MSDTFDHEGDAWDQVFNEMPDDPSLGPRCKFCGRTGLSWKQDAGKWRLYAYGGYLHNCEEYTALVLRQSGCMSVGLLSRRSSQHNVVCPRKELK